MNDNLTIGGLADRAGVTTQTLRAWEARFGFPTGRRTPSGHRRFSEADVTAVRHVVAAKEAGTPLRIAIGDVRRRLRQARGASVHRELVHDHPSLLAQRLPRRTLVAASMAIEDECLTRSDRPLVFGAFQHGYRFRRAQPRWLELARTASWCLVLADFADDSAPTDPASSGLTSVPVYADLPETAPMRREWSVACLSQDFSAVLSAWEIPEAGGEVYESVISTDHRATVAAARVMVSVATAQGTEIPDHVHDALSLATGPGVPSVNAGRDADRILSRVLARLS